MNTRRQFLVTAPLGVLGMLAACNDGAHGSGADSIASGDGLPVAGAAGIAAMQTSVADIPADAPTLNWIPQHKDLVYTFGGAAPRQRIKSGTRIVTWTEDCFDGAVKTAADLPSKKMTAGHDNPQTGPFYIEGAEPGDTVAIHILKLEPARSYAVSSFSPGFGALVGNDQTAMLGPDFPETTWRYDVDAKRTTARATSADGKYAWSVPLAPFLGCIGVAPAGGEVRTTIVPGNFGGNMDCPEVRAGNTVYLGVNVPGALLSFGDGHYAMGEGEIMGA
ncbi:MAG TPA: acetamidase/formamidase family protein, partial [Gemmatimonadaceae bacterium]|nr:acetamidase/formamidase family protein [Gemmatimonadaceae bacterium]